MKKNNRSIVDSGKLIHEELPSYKAASIVTAIVQRAPMRFGDLRNQTERASLSMTSNNAEGCARLQISEKNASHLLCVAKASAAEVKSFLRQAQMLFMGEIRASNQLGTMLDFAMSLIDLIYQELSILVDSPVRAQEPSTLNVFPPSDITMLDSIYRGILAGKKIEELIPGGEPKKSKTIKTKTVAGENQDHCVHCKKLFDISAGRRQPIQMNSSFFKEGARLFPFFFCNKCLEKHGKPISIKERGTVVWAKQLSQSEPVKNKKVLQ